MKDNISKSIILISGDGKGRKTIPAPPTFSWTAYPNEIEIDNAIFSYIGTIDATPHYQRKLIQPLDKS